MTANAALRVVVVLATVLAATALARAQQPPAPPTADFTVATFNVNYGNPDLDGIVRSIRKSDADLVVLQETNRQSEAFLRRGLKNTYPHMVFSQARDVAGGFAMLSKVPLEKSRYLPPRPADGGWFGTQAARVMLAGREMVIVNIHLTATVPSRNMDAKGLLALFARTEAVRDREIRTIVGALPKRWPVFVLGDFNSVPKLSGVPDFMTKSGFTDCLGAIIQDVDSVPTWHWKLRGVDYRTRLDYIFSARINAMPVSGAVLESDASDHYLVTCSFQRLPLPVALGPSRTEALNVVYLVDAAGMTPQRTATARGLVTASMAALTPAQNLCVVTPGGEEQAVPPEPASATDPTKALITEVLKNAPARPEPLLPAVRKAMSLLEDEAAPKVVFVLSDRLAKDPAMLKSVRALHVEARLQLFLLDAEGTPVAEAAGNANAPAPGPDTPPKPN